MSSATYQVLRKAIVDKQNVSADYKGYHRIMTPHTLGTKDGREKCLLYQFAGDSSKGPITEQTKNNWRCITISKLTNVSARDGEWFTYENHSRPSTCVDVIDIEVVY